MKAWTIVGYTYNADIYCVGNCITESLGETDPQSGLTEHVEARLDEIAAQRGIDRMDERSYDSGDFPKVIFASEEFPDYCPHCAGCGGVLDGFDPKDYVNECVNGSPTCTDDDPCVVCTDSDA
jgi:hypothetical protein